MTARKYPKNTCKQCGKTGIYVSQRHLCLTCSMANMHENAVGLHTKTGKSYENWRKALTNAVLKLAKEDK